MANGTASTRSRATAPKNPNNLPQTGELSEMTHDEKVKWAKGNTLLTEGQVEEVLDHVEHFTGSGYSGIRKAQAGDPNYSHLVKEGESCEQFIANAPQWDNSSPLYRGIAIKDQAVLDSIQVGKPFDVNNGGSASWSTKKKVSEDFATSSSGTPVIIECKKSTNAAPISHISHFYEEHEVLCSKKNKYRVVSKTKTKAYGYDAWHVEVEQYE